MAKKAANSPQLSDFIEVKDPDGNPARVTLQSFNNVWKDRGYSKVTKAEQSDSSQSSK